MQDRFTSWRTTLDAVHTAIAAARFGLVTVIERTLYDSSPEVVQLIILFDQLLSLQLIKFELEILDVELCNAVLQIICKFSHDSIPSILYVFYLIQFYNFFDVLVDLSLIAGSFTFEDHVPLVLDGVVCSTRKIASNLGPSLVLLDILNVEKPVFFL